MIDLMLYEHAGQNVCSLVVSFVVTGGRSWSFQSFQSFFGSPFFNTEQEKLSVLISIIWCADCVATYASSDQIFIEL